MKFVTDLAATYAPWMLSVFPLIPIPLDSESKRFSVRMMAFMLAFLVLSVILDWTWLAAPVMLLLMVDAVFDHDGEDPDS